MNRTLVIGGVAAIALLLGIAAWLLLGGKSTTTTPEPGSQEAAGPIGLNLVTVVTDHAASEEDEGRKLHVTFPNFEVTTKAGETTSAVFSTTWRLKLTGDQRALVAAATVNGYMRSTAPSPETPPPAATPAPAPTTSSTAPTTTPPADGSTTPAATSSQPTPPPAPPKPVAGDGLARVIVTVGPDSFVTEWTDLTGEGASRRIAKAAALTASSIDMRAGSTIPVTVTLEVSAGREGDATAKISDLDLRLFVEDAPLPAPPAEPSPPTTDAPPPAPPTPDAATPPAESTPPANP